MIESDDLKWADIPTMQGMSDAEYQAYIEDNAIIWLDHHDILRSSLDESGPPLATTREQINTLIGMLYEFKAKMKPRSQ